ncbi:MAG: hypothetical protein LBS03_08095 [Bacteroidales bacterium]|jgi:hypothetical protein|nr:hypothetical protein [Bacteroidales bacterium]
MMYQSICSQAEAAAMIEKGIPLFIAGSYEILAGLPKGNWIAGTAQNAILPGQKITLDRQLFIQPLPDFVTKTTIQEYDVNSFKEIFADAPENGFTFVIIPFDSEPHFEFSASVMSYNHFGRQPLCGWISWDVRNTGRTFSGRQVQAYSDKAVAMHVEFPPDKYAEIQIFNPYTQGTGDDITFESSGLVVKEACINGVKQNFAEYLRKINFNHRRFPLVGDYAGAMINVSCRSIEEDTVFLYAAVFPTIKYRTGVIDPAVVAPSLLSKKILLSLTCIVNYKQNDFCENYLQNINGLVTYGEIVYQLLNQTTVYLTVDDAVVSKPS